MRKPLVRYFVLAYLTFWVLDVIAGVTMILKAPALLFTIMVNVCSWSPTFVIAFQFKLFYPNITLAQYLKRNFLSKVNPLHFLLVLLIQSAIFAIAVAARLITMKAMFGPALFINLSSLLPTLLISITDGPMGEELGWRGFALGQLQNRFSPLTSALILGVLWGFWHMPAWFISGYSGGKLLFYILFFLVAIISMSIIVAFFYNKSKNILIAMWIHFLFNFLLQLTHLDLLALWGYEAAGYLVFALILVLYDRRTIFLQPMRAD